MLDGLLFDKLVSCEELALSHYKFDSSTRNILLDLCVIVQDPSGVSR